MISNKNNKLIVGIILAYTCLIFLPSVYFYPLPFIIFLLFSKQYFGDFRKALFTTAVFAIPYAWGNSLSNTSLIKAIFSFPGLIVLLAILSINKRTNKNNTTVDILLILFLFWGILSFFTTNTTTTVLNGILFLSLSILLYFLTKIYIKDKQVKKALILILISIVIFESFIAAVQFIVGHPLGLFIEETLEKYPYGRLASENILLFRPTGTFDEPTWFARFMTLLLPVVLINIDSIFKIGSRTRFFTILISLFAIIVSWTRFSMFVSIFLILLSKFWQKLKFRTLGIKTLIIISLIILISGLYIFPYFYQRVITSFTSFEEMGSFDVRLKLIQEAVNLIEQYPLLGVGLRQFSPYALDNNITGFFQNIMVAVHNVPLLIAAEMGIPALFFFAGFVIFSYKSYLEKIKIVKNRGQINFLEFAALGGIAYFLESLMGTIFLSPHLSLFLLYMAIIST